MNLSTNAKITWCPGCTNSQILVSFREAIKEMVEQGKIELKDLVVFSGIGCHGKITDYLNINSFTSLHGRLVPAMTGAKCANHKLTVIGFSGDGDSYDEGLEHLIHAAKRNSDVNLFVHNNKVFALTTGQANAVSLKGFKGKSTPFGNIEDPINPLLLVLSSGATFVARTYAGDMEKTKTIMQKAIKHKGFSFVDIIQPCVTFFDNRNDIKDKIYWINENESIGNFKKALELVSENDGRIPLGVFYDTKKSIFEEELSAVTG